MIQQSLVKPNSIPSSSNSQAWIAIGCVGVMVALLMAVGGGGLLRPLLPIMSFLVGIFLFTRYPFHYVGFAWSLWVLTPLIARIADYQSSWDPQRTMLVTPFLVSAISGVTMFRHLSMASVLGVGPFALVALGIGYGALIGAVSTNPMSMLRALLDWLVPVAFGFHLFWNWQDYPNYMSAIRKTFLWGVLLTGSYGIFQYITAPEWDCRWLIDSGMNSSLGKPEPFELRVWSTMHAAGQYASFLMAGLLLLLSDTSVIKLPATVVGYISFLLSLVRSSWGGWLIGFVVMVVSVKAKSQIRFVIFALIAAILIIPLSQMDPFSTVISGRISTLFDLENDTSFNARTGDIGSLFINALSKPLGNGIGNLWVMGPNGVLSQIVTDFGIADVFITLGWIGGIPYLLGTGMLLTKAMQSNEASHDSFLSAARAISFSMIAQMVFANALLSVSGMLIWSFLGISLAGDLYHRRQREAVNQYELEQLLLADTD